MLIISTSYCRKTERGTHLNRQRKSVMCDWVAHYVPTNQRNKKQNAKSKIFERFLKNRKSSG